MNINQLPAVGSPLEGGFYAGLFQIGAEKFALIVAPKAEGEHDAAEWGEYGKDIDNARSCFNGLDNTIAMAETGYKLGTWARGLNIAGYSDWYIPSRDELEICYRNLKPTTDENYCSFRDGDNASSIPVSYPYTTANPAQTGVEVFQQGKAEAFERAWYWSSTQYSADYAYIQHFADGHQVHALKVDDYRARAVRRLLVI